MLQVTTQQGMAAGLQADQTAKLAHIDSLKATATITGSCCLCVRAQVKTAFRVNTCCR